MTTVDEMTDESVTTPLDRGGGQRLRKSTNYKKNTLFAALVSRFPLVVSSLLLGVWFVLWWKVSYNNNNNNSYPVVASLLPIITSPPTAFASFPSECADDEGSAAGWSNRVAIAGAAGRFRIAGCEDLISKKFTKLQIWWNGDDEPSIRWEKKGRVTRASVWFQKCLSRGISRESCCEPPLDNWLEYCYTSLSDPEPSVKLILERKRILNLTIPENSLFTNLLLRNAPPPSESR